MFMTAMYLYGVPTVDHCKWFKSLVSYLVYFPSFLTLANLSRGVVVIIRVY